MSVVWGLISCKSPLFKCHIQDWPFCTPFQYWDPQRFTFPELEILKNIPIPATWLSLWGETETDLRVRWGRQLYRSLCRIHSSSASHGDRQRTSAREVRPETCWVTLLSKLHNKVIIKHLLSFHLDSTQRHKKKFLSSHRFQFKRRMFWSQNMFWYNVQFRKLYGIEINFQSFPVYFEISISKKAW